MTTSIGLRLKQLVLAFGAVFLGIVALTNLLNLLSVATTDSDADTQRQQLAVASVIEVYSWPGWFPELVVLGALLIEGTGAVLFARALLRYRGGGSGVVEAYQALAC